VGRANRRCSPIGSPVAATPTVVAFFQAPQVGLDLLAPDCALALAEAQFEPPGLFRAGMVELVRQQISPAQVLAGGFHGFEQLPAHVQ
jgi:hypothetical protein